MISAQDIRNFSDKIRFISILDSDDSERMRKVILLNITSVIGIATLLIIATNTLHVGNLILGLLDLTMAFVLILNLLYLNKTGSLAFSTYLGISLMGTFFGYLFLTGGEGNTGHLWVYSFPLFSIFILGVRKGSLYAMMLLLSVMIFHALYSTSPGVANYMFEFKLRFTLSYLIVAFFAFFSEIIRDGIQQRLDTKNKELVKNIARIKRTEEALRREIRERKMAQAEALRAKEIAEGASRTKSEFLANMSHELRTPLNHIIGFTELVVEKRFGGLNDAQEEYLNDVVTSSRHLLSLINDILDLSKVEAGKMELELTEVHLMSLLAGSLMMVREKAMKHGIRLELDTDGIPEIIRADERKLKQVMYNLLSNALKFTQEGGQIRLSAEMNSESGMKNWKLEKEGNDTSVIMISVSDTGIGIKGENLARIFQPFEQVDSSISRRYEGTGLGLSLTERFIELHGGKIWAESGGEGKGSTFRFVIPLHRQCKAAQGEGV